MSEVLCIKIRTWDNVCPERKHPANPVCAEGLTRRAADTKKPRRLEAVTPDWEGFSGEVKLKNKLAGRLPLSDRPSAFLVTPKTPAKQEKCFELTRGEVAAERSRSIKSYWNLPGVIPNHSGAFG